MLQRSQDRNDFIAAVEVQRHGIDGRAIQTRLLLNGETHQILREDSRPETDAESRCHEKTRALLAIIDEKPPTFDPNSVQKTWQFPCFSRILTGTS